MKNRYTVLGRYLYLSFTWHIWFQYLNLTLQFHLFQKTYLSVGRFYFRSQLLPAIPEFQLHLTYLHKYNDILLNTYLLTFIMWPSLISLSFIILIASLQQMCRPKTFVSNMSFQSSVSPRTKFKNIIFVMGMQSI